MTINGLVVTRNRAMARRGLASGGGMELDGETANLTNVVITYNRAVSYEAFGGGLEAATSLLTVTGGFVSLNVARGIGEYAEPEGGGMWIGGGATLTNLAITFNRAIGDGATDGGLFADPPATLNNVVVSANVP